MRRLVVRPGAEADLADAALWYEARAAGLGSEFLRSVDACLSEVARAPETFPSIHRSVRRALLRRFPYGVFFVVSDGAVSVIACLHVRRDPLLWTARLRNER
jgi:plasmid stabilization system protein ParE